MELVAHELAEEQSMEELEEPDLRRNDSLDVPRDGNVCSPVQQ
jgi:hypothetical protein